VRLTGEEAHHLMHVSRVRRGEQVCLFDGSGLEYDAIVQAVGKRDVSLSIVARRTVDRELAFPLTLACATPKGDRLRWLIEKATEMGVTRFVPLLTARASERARGTTPEKMRRWVIEASKQCGRNVLMEVTDATAWPEFAAAVAPAINRIIADRDGQPLGVASSHWLTRGVALAVGPEGGFTSAELDLARSAGWILVSLGPRTLRIETAALAIVASLACPANSVQATAGASAPEVQKSITQ
jgi:16S rRNA (uracil1498-N3)-methyltransferase